MILQNGVFLSLRGCLEQILLLFYDFGDEIDKLF